MKKYQYRLIINKTENVRGEAFQFDYRSTKGISFNVKKGGAFVSLSTDT